MLTADLQMHECRQANPHINVHMDAHKMCTQEAGQTSHVPHGSHSIFPSIRLCMRGTALAAFRCHYLEIRKASVPFLPLLPTELKGLLSKLIM